MSHRIDNGLDGGTGIETHVELTLLKSRLLGQDSITGTTKLQFGMPWISDSRHLEVSLTKAMGSYAMCFQCGVPWLPI